MVFLILFVEVFGQNSNNKIIFLNDIYSDYTKTAQNQISDLNDLDNIYKDKIQSTIINRYFLKSEYSGIVNDYLSAPVQNTNELNKAIERINSNKKRIKSKIRSALEKSNTYLKNDGLTIYVLPANPDNNAIMQSMSGIMGLTAGSKQILLTIEPEIVGWEEMLEYAVAHEFNHAYWTNLNFDKSAHWTLLDYLVFEGKGDYFAHSLYPNVIAPWTMALNEDQIFNLWNKIKPNLQSEDIGLQMEIMFGSNKYPVWGGYSIGYHIVKTALENNKNLEADYWTNLKAINILRESTYK
jgi:uncharacterized protein YjaZ